MPSWPGRRRRHNSDFNPRSQLASPFPSPPPSLSGSGRGRGSPGGPGAAGLRGAPAESQLGARATEVAGGRAVSGRGRRAAGDALFVCFAPGTGPGGGAGRGRGATGRGAGWARRRGASGTGRGRPAGGGRGLVRRLRERSRRPRAAIIPEPPFSGWLCLEEPRAVGAHPKLRPGSPLCERPRGAGGAGSAAAGQYGSPRRSLLETVHASVLN